LTVYQYWHRHNQGDEIMLLRSKHGASDAAKWAFENIGFVENYTVLNYNLNSLKNNYCSKWILQAFYYGANIKLTPFLTRLVLPQAFEYMKSLEKIALFLKGYIIISFVFMQCSLWFVSVTNRLNWLFVLASPFG